MLQRTLDALSGILTRGYLPFCLLMSAIAIAPWLFGSVQPWAQTFGLAALACGALLHFASSIIGRQTQPVVAPVWLLLAVVLLGLLQCIDLPGSLVSVLSPRAMEIRAEFGSSSTGVNQLSLEPSQTRLFVALLVGGALTVLLVSQLSNGWMLRPLLLVLAANGAMLASFALLQKRFGENQIYGVVDSVASAIGPFVNRNNAAGYLLASLAAALALVAICRPIRKKGDESERFRWQAELMDLTSSPTAIIALACVIAITAGLLLTASRGGLVGLATGVIALVLFTAKRRNAAGLAGGIAGVAFLAIAFLMAVESWAPSNKRFETLGDQSALARDGRLQIWESSVWMAADFWATGSGLGTFESVFPLYDRYANGTRATHAENGFVQMLAEGGVVGISLVVGAICLMLRHCLKLLASRNRRERLTGALGVFFLTSQVVANSFDFGSYIPANFILYCCLTGIVFRTETLGSKSAHEATQATGFMGFLLDHRGSLALAGLAVFALFSVNELMRASSVEVLPTGKEQASLVKSPQISGQQERLMRNIVFRWDDRRAHAAIAEEYIRQFERGLSERTGIAVSLAALADRIELARASGISSDALDGMAKSELARRFLVPAATHLNAANDACCLDANVHLRLYQLGFLDQSNQGKPGTEHLARCVRLREGYRYDLFEAGKESLANGDVDAAYSAWRTCLESRSVYRGQIVNEALAVSDVDLLLDELFPAEPWFLTELLQRHLADESFREHRQLITQRLQAIN